MLVTYHHLNEAERNQIQGFLQSRMSIRQIAKAIHRSPSTVSDEISRNSFQGLYFGITAHLTATNRRKATLEDRAMDRDEPMEQIRKCLEQKLSPEEIVGRLKREGMSVPAVTTIYTFIADDRRDGGDLHRMLRRAGKTYRNRYGSKSGNSECGIKNRISIEKRPKIVDEKSRLGDFEVDTVFGSRHRGVILSMIDRKSRKAVLEKCPDKTAYEVSKAAIRGVKRSGIQTHTMTFDNGKEFAHHERIARETGAETYFCHPMSPHERGSNENLNGLIREYLPKGMDLTSITQKQLLRIEESLNKRPRKILGYLTPDEVVAGGKILYHFAA